MREKKSNFRGKVNSDAQTQKNARSSSGYLNLPRGIKVYNAESEVKKVKLDFLPYVITDPNHPCKNPSLEIAMVGDQWWYRPFKIHRDVGSDRKTSTVVCPHSVGKKCPICDYQKKLFDQGAPKTETVPLYPKDRALYVVIPLGQKAYEETPHVWDMSKKMFHDILVELLEEDDSNEVFPALDEGKTLEISFKWDTIGEKGKPFPEARNIIFSDREPYDEKILDEVPNLDDILVILPYEELSNKFFGIDDEPDAGKLNDVEDEPLSRSERSRKSAEPDAEKEPPARSSRRASESAEKEPPARTSRRAPVAEKEKDALPTWDELTRIGRENLATMITAYELPLDIELFEDTDEGDVDIRKSIAQALDIEVPEDKPKPTRGSVSSSVKEKETAPAKEKTPPPAEKSARMSRAGDAAEKGRTGGDAKDKCPTGHVFGKDTERFDDCDECKAFDACLDAKRNK
jgi:hypothetical protein